MEVDRKELNKSVSCYHTLKQSMETHLYWFIQQLHIPAGASCEGWNHWVLSILKYTLNFLYGKQGSRVHCWELLSCLSMKMIKALIYAFMLSYSLFNCHWGWFVTLEQFGGSQGFQTAQNANAISPSINGRRDTHSNNTILSGIILNKYNQIILCL